ncbi:MAG: c-type cytochrome biogenesis protein CcmI [Alphaproteobacteria bacterium]|nr:c-type cytochrome biogenesis protein CcmI [Alphaproteobacteria bacterium]
MMFWAILLLLVAIGAGGLSVSVLRPRAHSYGQSGMSVLKAQLAEIDLQLARGELKPEAAERFRAEIKRRALSEGDATDASSRPISKSVRAGLAAAIAAFVVAASAGLYFWLGNPGLTQSFAPEVAQVPPASSTKALDAMILALKHRATANPRDVRTWRVLGWIYLASGHPSDAANAYGRAITLDSHDAADFSAQGDALVQAAAGQVTPAARADFDSALAINPADPRARYFLALFKEQHGDHAAAMHDWVSLLQSAPAHAPWLAAVRHFVDGVARAHGEDLSVEMSKGGRAGVSNKP